MGGDYTRFTFDPAKGYTGVLKQQGRVGLDSDHNELIEIDERRDRVTMMDAVGRCAVPITTPNGFAIALDVNQRITIGVGRAYVDGVLAECLGKTPWNAYDPATGELRGTTVLPYAEQPFFYSGPNIAGTTYPALSTTAGTTNVVHLHVRQREVTVVEDPSLQEPALGGPDPTTRYQTQWQVKCVAVPATDAVWCEDAPNAYSNLTAPSSGRLATSYVATASTTPGPCVIDPAGGYTGLENRLYRVEIRKSGGFGTAEFVWSRDNASLTAEIKDVKTVAGRSAITVSRLGWDQVVRLQKNDWIELLDDDIEFAQYERGLGGPLVQIADVDEPNSVVYVSPPVAFTRDAARHPRLRRWDTNADAPTQAVTRSFAANTPLVLEKGIQVTFTDPAGSALPFRAGDYWLIWARTATGTIDIFGASPPRGPKHHFCKLALVTPSANPPVHDCRDLWPNAGCCTVVVKPGRDIQRAINSLPAAGGCICLKTGVHQITRALELKQSNVCIHGEAPGTTVRNTASDAVLVIEPFAINQRLSNIAVETIRFEGTEDAAGSGVMVDVERVSDFVIRECQFAPATAVPPASILTAVAVRGTDCDHGVVEHNAVDRLTGGISFVASSAAVIGEHSIRDNELAGPTNQGLSAGDRGIYLENAAGTRTAVLDNRISDYHKPVSLIAAGTAPVISDGAVVVGNTITRTGPLSVQPSPAPSAEPYTFIATKEFAINVNSTRATVAGNTIRLGHMSHGGILATQAEARVEHNRLLAPAQGARPKSIAEAPWGVALGASPTNNQSIDRSVVRANLFTGSQCAIGAFADPGGQQPSTEVRVIGNTIEGSRQMFVTTAPTIVPPLKRDFDGDIRQTFNTLQQTPLAYGIFAFRVDRVEVANNRIRYTQDAIRLGFAADSTVFDNEVVESVVGTTCVTCQRVVVRHNRLDDVSLFGIAVSDSERVCLDDNQIRGQQQNFGSIRNTRAAVVLVDAGSGPGARVADNYISDCDYGIAIQDFGEVSVEGNDLRDLCCTGIYLDSIYTSITCTRNTVARAGALGMDLPVLPTLPFLTRASLGIVVLSCAGLVSLEECRVTDTGEPPDRTTAPKSTAPRLSISAWRIERVRVHGCVVIEPRLDTPNALSGALRCMTMVSPPNLPVPPGPTQPPKTAFDVADVSDNYFEGDYVLAVGLTSTTAATLGRARGEAIFTSNRCTNLRPRPADVSVRIGDYDVVTATSNRVSANGTVNSFAFQSIGVLTAVANVAHFGTGVAATTLIPAPYANFNATT